jgi:hypothetical protein
MDFEWDPEKADANRRKHKVSFEEARTIFDPAKPEIFEATKRFALSAPGDRIRTRRLFMPKPKIRKVKFTAAEMAYDLPAEMDMGKLRYVGRGVESLRDWNQRRRRTVELDKDVAKVFTDSAQVNEALRLVKQLREVGKPKRRKSA